MKIDIKDILNYILQGFIFLLVVLLIYVQFDNFVLFSMDIKTANYFTLLSSALMYAVAILPLVIRKNAKVEKSDLLIVAFVTYMIVHGCFFNSIDSNESRMAISYALIYFASKYMFKTNPKVIDLVIIALLVSGIYQSSLVLKQLFGYTYSNHARFDVTGTFFNPGPCGIYISAILVLAAGVVKTNALSMEEQLKLKSWREYLSLNAVKNLLAYITLSLTFIALVSTFSRAGVVGALIAILLMYRKEIQGRIVLISNKLRIPKKVMLTCMVTCFIGGLIGVYLVKQGSADGRLFMWRNTIDAITEKPVFGVGVGNFEEPYSASQTKYFLNKDVLVNYDKNIAVVSAPDNPFNELLSLTLQLGIVGLLLALGALFFKATNAVKGTDNDKIMGYVVLSLSIAALFSYPFYVPAISIISVISLAAINETKTVDINVWWVIVPLVMVLAFLNKNIKQEVESNKEWKTCTFLYNMKDYESCVKEYGELLTHFEDDHKFKFEYRHSLNKTGEYEYSNEILYKGVKNSTDPMFWNIIGNNYAALGEVKKSEEAYLKAYYLCPSRIYPIYLLTILFHNAGDVEKTQYYGNILIQKEPKVETEATRELKDEVNEILKTI